MRPLIVRPQPQADALASQLRQAGHNPVVTPLLEIIAGRGLTNLATQLAPNPWLIAVSAAAVEQAHLWLQSAQRAWPDTRPASENRQRSERAESQSISGQRQRSHPRAGGAAGTPSGMLHDARVQVLRPGTPPASGTRWGAWSGSSRNWNDGSGRSTDHQGNHVL